MNIHNSLIEKYIQISWKKIEIEGHPTQVYKGEAA